MKYSTDPWHDTWHRSPFITTSNKDVSIMSSKCKGTAAADPLLTTVKHKSNKCEETIERRTSKRVRRIERRVLDTTDSEAEDVFDIVGNEKNLKSKNLEYSAHRLIRESSDDSSDVNQEDGTGVKRGKDSLGANTKVVPGHLGVRLPQSPSTRSTFLSCLHSKPRVVLRRLPVTTRRENSTSVGQAARTMSPVATSARSRPFSQHPKSDVDFSNWRNKE